MRWWTEQRGEVECSEDDMPFSSWATRADVKAAQAAIIQEIQKMSATLESQLQTLIANVAADAATISADQAATKQDLDMILARLSPGSTLTQADIDAMTAVSTSMDASKNAMDALKTAADAGANPAPAPAP